MARTVRWKEGRPGKRRGRRPPPPRPNPLLDGLAVLTASLVSAGAVLTFAIFCFSTLGWPVHVVYGVGLPLLALAGLWLAPRARPGLALTLLFSLLWLGGSGFLYAVRDDLNPLRHYHGPPSAAHGDAGASRPSEASGPSGHAQGAETASSG